MLIQSCGCLLHSSCSLLHMHITHAWCRHKHMLPVTTYLCTCSQTVPLSCSTCSCICYEQCGTFTATLLALLNALSRRRTAWCKCRPCPAHSPRGPAQVPMVLALPVQRSFKVWASPSSHGALYGTSAADPGAEEQNIPTCISRPQHRFTLWVHCWHSLLIANTGGSETWRLNNAPIRYKSTSLRFPCALLVTVIT